MKRKAGRTARRVVLLGSLWFWFAAVHADQARLQWFGQSAFKLTSPGGKVILIDPFISNNPKTPEAHKDLAKLGIEIENISIQCRHLAAHSLSGGGSVTLARDVIFNRGTIVEVDNGSAITIGTLNNCPVLSGRSAPYSDRRSLKNSMKNRAANISVRKSPSSLPGGVAFPVRR